MLQRKRCRKNLQSHSLKNENENKSIFGKKNKKNKYATRKLQSLSPNMKPIKGTIHRTVIILLFKILFLEKWHGSSPHT